ncbi:MAG: SDR family oxidoreductase [Candidatus Taylorbacteria bacterium]
MGFIQDKVVVITGASRGLGKSLANVLASKGAKLVISGRNKKDLEEVAEEISKKVKVLAVVADITKENEVIHIADMAMEKFGRIDIWINNAGVWLPKMPIEEIDMKKAHELIEVNLFGTIYGVRAAITAMKKRGDRMGDGMIVNIISTSALQGRPNQSVYSASKHAAKGFTDSIREELLMPDNAAGKITVIGVYPGGIKTSMFDAAKPADFDDFMDPDVVAAKIVENLEKDKPEVEQILKRQGQEWNSNL